MVNQVVTPLSPLEGGGSASKNEQLIHYRSFDIFGTVKTHVNCRLFRKMTFCPDADTDIPKSKLFGEIPALNFGRVWEFGPDPEGFRDSGSPPKPLRFEYSYQYRQEDSGTEKLNGALQLALRIA
ncbi:MAG: hypothetical protein CMN32_16055 [Saprospirales bacterium]|nr:hypothetical protein [Saprospirales bacterium]